MSLKRKMINDKRKDDNSNNRQHFIAVAAAIFTLGVIIVASSMATTATPAAATTTPTPVGNTTSSSSGIQLSPQPIYQERSPEGNMTPINQTHGIFTFSGNGTLTLPNTTQIINTTHNGTAIISFTTSSGYGNETIRTENGETATATLYEIVQFNPAAPAPEGSDGGEGKGIVTAVFQTNSTGMLAPLNGVIAAGIDDMRPNGDSHVTLWRWESGISNSGVAPPPPTSIQGEPSMNSSSNTTTTTTTDEASEPSSPLTAAPY
jgi:hypothetical protein